MQTTEQLLGVRRRLRDSTLRTPAAGAPGLGDEQFCAVEVVEPPAPPRPIEPRELTMLTLLELVLKDRPRLYQALRLPAATPRLLPRLLAISLTGFVLYGVAMSLVFTATGRWPTLTALSAWLEMPRSTLLAFTPIDSTWGNVGPWINGEAAALVAAYAFGLIAASAVCLPSLYFYCLLAGVRMTMLEVVIHAQVEGGLGGGIGGDLADLRCGGDGSGDFWRWGVGARGDDVAGVDLAVHRGPVGDGGVVPRVRAAVRHDAGGAGAATRVFLAKARVVVVGLLHGRGAGDDLYDLGDAVARMKGVSHRRGRRERREQVRR